MLEVNEVIVVEGKADTAAIQRTIKAETIETNGSALAPETLAAIKTAAATRGIIIFTDPDFNGERLRKMITAVVPTAKHAFLTKDEAGRLIKHHSLGIEYATDDDIETALKAVASPVATEIEATDITSQDLLSLGLMAGAGAAQRRRLVAEHLGLGYVNGKQLLKRLQLFGIQKEQLLATLREIED